MATSTAQAEASAASWLSQLARLEEKLGGGDSAQWPAAWGAPATGEPPRLGVAAADIAAGGFRRAGSADPGTAIEDRKSDVARVLSHRADELFPAASTIKVFVLQALMEAAARGELALDERRPLTGEDQVSGSGVLKLLAPGAELSLLDLATLMITVSDNSATNMLIDVVGVERIRQCVATNGWLDTHLRGKLQLGPVVAGNKSSPSHTSPRDLADYFSRLWSGELLPADLTETSKGIYRRQQYGELGRSLDYDSYSAEIGASEMSIASKSGSIRGVRNDAGVIEFLGRGSPAEPDGAGAVGGPGRASGPAGPDGPDRPYVYEDVRESYVVAVMSSGCPDRRFHPDNLGALIVGEAAALTLFALRGA